jgi:hypothetical protein
MTADELARRLQPPRFGQVRLDLVVILQPIGQLWQDRVDIRTITDLGVLALDGLHERLSHTGLRVGMKRGTRPKRPAHSIVS